MLYSIHQSGEIVVTCGLYEVVGAGYVYQGDQEESEARRQMNPGDVFPDFKGRAVCWCLIRVVEYTAPASGETPKRTTQTMTTPWQLD
jgi:hypothetical protein